ncbi:MAG: hypothetical protein JW770_05200 [Actinobacteria bacterium]|nr:hypothetical protein [Actinomycetota bacterium]
MEEHNENIRYFIKYYIKILSRNLGFLLAGSVPGFLFYYFFRETAVFIIEKFKIFQGIFGIMEYQDSASSGHILLVILAGNLLSTAAYTALGYLRTGIPVSFISGFFIIIFLFTGTIRHGIGIPVEVMILVSMEMFYRMMAASTGEFTSRYRKENKLVIIVSAVVILMIYLGAALYEMHQIFG